MILPDLDDSTRLVLALSENLQRQDLTPFEEAWAIFKLVKDNNMGIQGTAKRIDRPEVFVRNRLKLLSLPQEVQELLAHRRLSLAHIDALVSLRSSEDQLNFAKLAVDHRLSETELALAIEKELGQKVVSGRKPKNITGKRAEIRIDQFAIWLDKLMPTMASWQGSERHNIGISLEHLIEKALEVQTVLGTSTHQARKGAKDASR